MAKIDAKHFAKLLVDDLERQENLQQKYEYAEGYIEGLVDSAFELGLAAGEESKIRKAIS